MNQTLYLIAIICFGLTSARLLDESIKESSFELDNDDEIEDYEQIFQQSKNAEAFINSQLPKLNSKQKRFLGSILDIFRSKNKTHTTISYGFDEHTTAPTTKYKPTINHQSSTLLHTFSDDPFYKLKQYCIKTYDSFCISKKNEISSLVQKCSTYEKNIKPESCKEVLSIYCYVFASHDIYTCYRNDYDIYVPGVKKFGSGTTQQSLTTRSTSRVYIPVVHVTTSSSYKPFSFTSFRSHVTYSTTTQRTAAPTTRSTTKLNDINNPFDGHFTTIPNDPEKLKKIGQYCLKIKSKDANCDRALTMLRDKFRKCEKSPKSDTECQTFKMNLCGAFSNFPCCADPVELVLDQRQR